MELEELRVGVISVMKEIPDLSHFPLDELTKIPLGLMRKGTALRHGVCRWNRGAPLEIHAIKGVNLHPDILDERWSRYAKFVLYHEFLHALGHRYHDNEFYTMEGLWPDEAAIEMKEQFSDFVMKKYCKWELICTSCNLTHLRSRRPTGRYNCLKCKSRMACNRRELVGS